MRTYVNELNYASGNINHKRAELLQK